MHRFWVVCPALGVAAALALAVAGPLAAAPSRVGPATPSAAAAAPEQPEGTELKRKAQELLTEGNRLANSGDFVAALVKFRAAYELFPSPKLLLNIGTSQRQLGRYAEAAASYERYLASSETEPVHGRAAERALAELAELVGYLQIEPPEAGARVLLDGNVVGPAELGTPVRVDPGHHTLVADKEGRAPTVRQVTVLAGDTVVVALPLAAPGEAPPEPIPVQPIVGYGIAALGGAAIVVAVILGVVAGATDAEARELCAAEGAFAGYCTEEGARLTDSARDLSVAALVTGLTGAAVGLAGLTIALTTPSEPAATAPAGPPSAAPGPSVDEASLGLVLEGRW